MSADKHATSLPTRVARAVPGGNEFFGFRVETELTDEDALWRGLLLSLGAGPESFAHLAIVKRLAGCNLVADPRIWPLKITRVVSSYGNAIPALCAGNVFLESARVGPLTAKHAAEFLEEMVGFYDGVDGALEEELLRRLANRERFAGYGVAFRPQDERVVVIDRIVMEQNRADGRYWKCSKAIEAILGKTRRLPRNVVSASAAVLLDCGFTPRQIGLLMWYYFAPTFFANAVEGAAQRPEVLRNLPLSAVAYVGAAPRVSPSRLRFNAA